MRTEEKKVLMTLWTLLNLLVLKAIRIKILFLTEAGLDGVPDSFAVVEFGLRHSGMESNSFSNKGPGELRGGKLFIGEIVEYLGGMKGGFIVVPEDVSEEKTEHDGTNKR